MPHGAFDGKISQRGLTLPTSTIVPFPTYYGQSRNNAPTQWGLGRYVGVQFARPAHGENTRIACNPVLFTIKTMPCFGTTRNYDAAAGGHFSNFSAVRAGKIIGELNQLNTRTAAAQLKRFRTVNLLIWLSATSPFFPAVLNVANYIANVNQKERNLLQLIIFSKLLYQFHRKWSMFFHIPKQIFPFDDTKFAQTLGEIRQA